MTSARIGSRARRLLELGASIAAVLLAAAGCADDASSDAARFRVMEGNAPEAAGAPKENAAPQTPSDAQRDDPASSPAIATPPTAKAPSDDCSARVVSRMKPCSADPDPCKLNSGWDGDAYCLLPPAPEEGIQLHFGPKSYADKAATAAYTIAPNTALNESFLARVPLDEDRFVGRVTVHMRPGVDHWISTRVPAGGAEAVYRDMGCGGGGVGGPGAFGGGQNLIYDDPPHGVPAPENANIARKFPGKASACLDLYALNKTDKPQLREAWVNIYFTDEPKDPPELGAFGSVGGLSLNLPPGQSEVLTTEGTFDGDGRIIQLLGNRHQWTKRLAVFLNDALIYDSWQWEELVTYDYDSITMNPSIDPNGGRDGAASGILAFKAGDRLKYSCFIENTSSEALTFSNDLEHSETCNLWGTTVGAGRFQESR